MTNRRILKFSTREIKAVPLRCSRALVFHTILYDTVEVDDLNYNDKLLELCSDVCKLYNTVQQHNLRNGKEILANLADRYLVLFL